MDEKFGVAARHTTLKDEINEEDIPAVEIIRLESKTNKAIYSTTKYVSAPPISDSFLKPTAILLY